jgi:hypothetical protein
MEIFHFALTSKQENDFSEKEMKEMIGDRFGSEKFIVFLGLGLISSSKREKSNYFGRQCLLAYLTLPLLVKIVSKDSVICQEISKNFN